MTVACVLSGDLGASLEGVGVGVVCEGGSGDAGVGDFDVTLFDFGGGGA